MSRAYVLMSYAEESAAAALDALEMGAMGLPDEYTKQLLLRRGLTDALKQLQPLMSRLSGKVKSRSPKCS